MVLKVGINGFGRIGRVIFRTCLQNNDLEVAAINDPAIDIDYICYLLKFDSTHGKLNSDITLLNNEITIEGNTVKVFREKLPSNIPWQTASVQYVVEASGMFTSYEKASGHLSSQCVRRVLVTAPSADVPMLIIGVNEESIKKDHRVISCASSTLYCLAPIIKLLDDNYHVIEGFITSIHAMTPSLKPLDGLCLRGKHWRDHRSIHQNIIPAATGACKALGKILPGVKDKLTGLAFRVPIVNVSVLDINIRLNQNTSIHDIVKCINNESSSGMKNIIKTSYDEAVSSDFLGEEKSCILDVNSCLQLTPNFFKLICWYENEHSYACRVVDSMILLDKKSHFDLVSKMTYTKPLTSEIIDNGLPIPFYNQDNKIYCNNIFRNNSREFGLTQNTVFKSKFQRHLCARQPLFLRSSGTNQSVREPTQRNGICKLLEDDERISQSSQERGSSFFQSCIAFGLSNKERSSYIKTQENLEEIKKDFSRMVDMTQNLLRKSKECNIPLMTDNSTEKKIREKVSTDDDSETYSKCNSLSHNYYHTESYKVNDNVLDSYNKVKEGDKKLTVNNKRLLNDHEYLHSKENNSSEILLPCEKTLNKKDILEKNNVNNKRLLNDHEYLHSKENNSSEILLPCEKTLNKKDILEKNNVNNKRLLNDHEYLQSKENNSSEILLPWEKTLNKKDILEKNKCSLNNLEKSGNDLKPNEDVNNNNPCSIDDIKNEIDYTRNFKESFTVLVNNTSTKVNEPTSKRELELHNLYPNDNKDTGTVEHIEPKDNIENDIEVNSLSAETVIRATKIRKKFIEGIIKKLSLESCNSPCPDNTKTTKRGRGNKILDIYDKLDSISATDSDNSFEINGKTSEVIEITDLTNSVEDLARLDKICRIIEISDELSDKLFSALDSKNEDYKKKKWSFKNLCENIKLDDFCNKVFGQPVSK